MFLRNPAKTLRARDLRKNQTSAEKIVWEMLRNSKYKGLKFRRQFVIEGFILDFYCMKLKLAIEIDGKVHENQKEYDHERQKIIESEGISFIRMSNEEIFNTPELLSKQIDKYLKKL